MRHLDHAVSATRGKARREGCQKIVIFTSDVMEPGLALLQCSTKRAAAEASAQRKWPPPMERPHKVRF